MSCEFCKHPIGNPDECIYCNQCRDYVLSWTFAQRCRKCFNSEETNNANSLGCHSLFTVFHLFNLTILLYVIYFVYCCKNVSKNN